MSVTLARLCLFLGALATILGCIALAGYAARGGNPIGAVAAIVSGVAAMIVAAKRTKPTK